jgi:hypothetical protein
MNVADKLVNVKADKATQFIDNAHKAMGNSKRLGFTTHDLGVSFTFQQTIAKVTLTFKTETTRVHWSGQVKTKPDPDNMAAIKQIEGLNAAHEARHRATYQDVFDKGKADLEKQLIGKTQTEAKAIVDDFNKKLIAACEKLHTSEGNITVTDSGGKISVTEGPEGPGGCK